MIKEKNTNHFQGKSVKDHVDDVNGKATSPLPETHGFPKKKFILFFGGFKQLLICLFGVSFFLSLALPKIVLSYSVLFSLGLMYLIWTTLQHVWQKWSYLELCHRWINEERKEIDTNLDQELQELRYIYENKGFQGDLLNNIVNYFGSDANLLLQSMVEEEFGVNLKSVSHPIQEGLVLFTGGFVALLFFLSFYRFLPNLYSIILVGLTITFLNTLTSHSMKNQKIKSVIWSLTIFFFSIMFSFFTYKMLVA